MGRVIKRKWLSRGPTGHKVKRVAYGYTCQVGGKQEREFNAAWTWQDAFDALSARLVGRDAPQPPPKPKTLGEVIQEYLDFKRAKGKRALRDDEHRLARIRDWFGKDTLIPEVTAQRIAQYDRDRVTQISRRKRPVSPATVNRELSNLRHLLRLAEGATSRRFRRSVCPRNPKAGCGSSGKTRSCVSSACVNSPRTATCTPS